jgi:predicted small metal-binding protein
MLSITCRDVGQNCDCVVQGETEEELMKNAAEHAVKDHGYTEQDIMTPRSLLVTESDYKWLQH